MTKSRGTNFHQQDQMAKMFGYMKVQKFGAKSATADSCFGLIGPRQCSAALGGPATSTEDLRHQGALNKPGVLKHLWVSFHGNVHVLAVDFV